MFPVLFNPSHGGKNALLLLAGLYPVHPMRRIQSAISGRRLRIAVRRLQRLQPGDVPDREVLAVLRDGWGNKGFAATLDYLEHTAERAARTEGPILECGSGVTTLLLGLLAGRRGVPVLTLEHHGQWRDHVASALERFDIPNVTILHVPLRDYGAYQWYAIHETTRPPVVRIAGSEATPEASGAAGSTAAGCVADSIPSDIRLVICDGPPGFTPGGRYGLMPLVGERLARNCTILLDDTERKSEQQVIDRWAGDHLLTGRHCNLTRLRGFAEITLA